MYCFPLQGIYGNKGLYRRTFSNVIPLKISWHSRLSMVKCSQVHLYSNAIDPKYFDISLCRHTSDLKPTRVMDTVPIDILQKTRGLPSKVRTFCCNFKFKPDCFKPIIFSNLIIALHINAINFLLNLWIILSSSFLLGHGFHCRLLFHQWNSCPKY